MLTYVGRGYTPAFTANYDAIITRLGAGETIELAAGPDDVCTPLVGIGQPHCHNDSVIERDRLARLAVADLLADIDLAQPFQLDQARLTALRAAFSTGHIRPACTGCEWSGLCDSVAQSGYAGASLAIARC